MTKYDKSPTELRPDIIRRMLRHVPYDGWSDAAMRHTAKDLGVSFEFVKMAFPGGVREMVETYLDGLDKALLERLAKKGLDKMGMTQRITTAIWTRLEMNAEHREAVRRTVGYLALPFNAPLSAKCLWRTADAMWRAAGDTSTDYNYYTKRMILSGVYSSTLLAWLNDKSEGYKETDKFLQNRIGDVMKFEKAKGKFRELTKDLPNPFKILGEIRYPEGHGRKK